jgi:hypothetical protein
MGDALSTEEKLENLLDKIFPKVLRQIIQSYTQSLSLLTISWNSVKGTTTWGPFVDLKLVFHLCLLTPTTIEILCPKVPSCPGTNWKAFIDHPSRTLFLEQIQIGNKKWNKSWLVLLHSLCLRNLKKLGKTYLPKHENLDSVNKWSPLYPLTFGVRHSFEIDSKLFIQFIQEIQKELHKYPLTRARNSQIIQQRNKSFMHHNWGLNSFLEFAT